MIEIGHHTQDGQSHALIGVRGFVEFVRAIPMSTGASFM